MYLDEANAARRTVRDRLYDLAGNALPLDHVFQVGDLKIIQPNGTVANATNLPAGVAGAAAGSFDFVVDRAELQQEGRARLQLNAAGVAFWEWVESVEVPPVLATDTRLNDLDASISSRATPSDVSGGGTVDAAAIAAAVVAIAGQSLSVVRVQPQTTGVRSYDLGDLEPPMRLKVPFDGVNDTLTLAVSAEMRWKKPDGTVTTVPLTFADKVASVVQRTWDAGDTDMLGIHTGEVIITWPNGRIATVQTVYQWTVRATL